VLLCIGCSRAPSALAPEPGAIEDALLLVPGAGAAFPESNSQAFIPLAIGNEWNYRGHIVEESLFDDGPSFRAERDYDQDNELVCNEERSGRSYVVERQTQSFGSVGFTQWVRFRQTSTGLFEADVPVNDPPACDELAARTTGTRPGLDEGRLRLDSAAGQAAYDRARASVLARLELARRAAGLGVPAAGEDLKRLAYPLYVGAQWQIRSAPLFTARVVARENVSVPAGRMGAFKVQIQSEPVSGPQPRRNRPQLLGPRDRVYFWVGRNGFLLYTFGIVGTIIDVEGNPIGELTVSERRELVDYAIERPLPWASATAASGGYSLTTR
jgi:hypothetical protein